MLTFEELRINFARNVFVCFSPIENRITLARDHIFIPIKVPGYDIIRGMKQ